MKLRRWIKLSLLTGAALLALVVALAAGGIGYLKWKHLPVIRLDSEKGQAMLQRRQAVDYLPLKQNWVQQLQMHCCAASAVIVMNSLQPGEATRRTTSSFQQLHTSLPSLNSTVKAPRWSSWPPLSVLAVD